MLLNRSEQALIEDGRLAAAHQLGQLDPAYAQLRDQTRFWIQRVAVPMIMVVGLFGNLITVIIMTRRRMRSTTNMYLAALAFVDMLYLVLTFLLGLSHYPNVARRKYYLYWRLKPFLMMLTDSCSNTSVWLTVTFTIERFIAVRFPIRGKVWCTEARAKRLIVCVFLFAILFTLPTPFEWNVVERPAPGAPSKSVDSSVNVSHVTGDNMAELVASLSPASGLTHSLRALDESQTSKLAPAPAPDHQHADAEADDEQVLLALEYSDFGSNDTYKTIYYWSTAAIFYFIPLLSLTFFNGFLIHSVHQSRRERNKMTNQRVAAAANTTSAACAANTPVLDGRHNGTLSAAASKSDPNLLEGAQNARPTARLVSEGSGDSFPEVKFKVIGEWVENQDDHSEADAGPRALERAILDNQPSVCDKRDSNLLSGAFLTSGPLQASSAKFSHHQHQQTSAVRAARAAEQRSLMERSDDLKGTNEADAITRLYLAGADNRAALGAGSLKVELREKGARGAASNGNGAASAGASPGGQLVSLDSSLTNNHSSCSSYNETAAPAHQQSTMAPASSQERRITIMLISVVILFLVCQIPTAAMLLYTSVHETIPNTNEQALQLALGNIFNFLMAVNAAGNFILYSFLSKKYRRTFLILFCGCLRRAPREPRDNSPTRSRWSCFASNSRQQSGKTSSFTINTTSSAADEAATRRWTSVRFCKVPKATKSIGTGRILIKGTNQATKDLSIKVADRRRRDTLV